MTGRGRSCNPSSSESPLSRNQHHTTTSGATPIVPRGQNRPGISVERSRFCIRRDSLDSLSEPEDTSPTYPRVVQRDRDRLPSVVSCTPSSSASSSGRSTPVSTPLPHVNARMNCCDHERQFVAVQRSLAALTEKIDNLQGLSTAVVSQRSRVENLPRDMVACVHKVVAKLKEKDPPIEWTLGPVNSFNDETNSEVSEAIERGVRATSAFKEANPVILERAIKTYFKTLKAKQKRVATRVRVQGVMTDKQNESVVFARRNQRGHNKLKARKEALRQCSYSEEKKRKLQEVLTIDYMSPEDSVYEDNSEEESTPKLVKLVKRKFGWRSDELARELQSLDRKAHRARSERAKRMMIQREQGAVIPDSERSFPRGAPAWALTLVPERGV
ncbi:hypothetical protein ACROYT_G016321 [Oculina patagonica]